MRGGRREAFLPPVFKPFGDDFVHHFPVVGDEYLFSLYSVVSVTMKIILSSCLRGDLPEKDWSGAGGDGQAGAPTSRVNRAV